MFGSKVEDEFANNISASAAAARGVSFWPVVLLINCGLALFVVWAYFSEIEEITSGQGRVIPSSQLQVVQTLEGGIISSIQVAEGDLVEKGQILMLIDDTGFSSKLGELKQKQSSQRAERVRLLAEADLRDALEFSSELNIENPTAIAAEIQVFKSRRIQLQNELNVLQNRLAQRRAELVELAANENKQKAILVPLRKEADLTIKMFKRGVVPEIELLRLQSRLAEIEGAFNVIRAAAPKVEASITEAENTIETTKNAYVLSARERLAKLEAELAVVNETMRAASDRVSRTQLRAPVRGVVNKVNATTVGAVVQPGRDIIEIVPVDDSLLVEARIRPQDVAFIKPNEPASVKLTAYDYLIYGSLKGHVVRIGADTTTDANGESFYQVVVRTEQNYIGSGDKKYPIIPGMVATVDIQAGTNTVLSYLLKPILRARSEAFRER